MSELLNRMIGGYQLLGKIGGGGVAEVFRARQHMDGARDVAVKVIYPEFARQPGVAANFAQIARAAAQLASHPHILPVLATGEDHEHLYIVTPLVEEGTLAGWMEKGGRLGAGDVGPFFQQLCGAVSYTHSLGLTHGNIKPSNVYLFEGRHVLLGDFGLLWDVRALDPSWSGSDVAAFEFLAPEVFDGRTSPSSDIYSLGATLFATLTGRAPFHSARLGDLVNAARQQTPPSLGEQTPPITGPVLALDGVVRQAMAKQVEQRFGSAAQFGQAIEATLRQAAQNPQMAPLAQPVPQIPPSPAIPMGVNIAAPPQWGAPPPIPSAPVPQGVVPPASVFGGSSAPLGQLNPPFPPLPPMAEPEPAMETGGGGALFGAPATRRVEPPQFSSSMIVSPLEGPTMLVPAAPDAQHDPFTELEQSDPTSRRGMAGRAHQAVMPLARTPLSEPLPAVDDQSGQFSVTELGLPRLTTPEMAGLPAGWRDLLTDESARHRHDPLEDRDAPLAPLPPESSLPALPSGRVDFDRVATERVGLDGIATSRVDPRVGERAGGAWEESGVREDWRAIEPRQPWEPSESEPEIAGGRRGASADYDIERMSKERAPMRRGLRQEQEPDDDTLQGQKVWTNSHTIVRGKRRSKAPFFTIVTLLILSALEMAGLAVMRPDICVTHACAVVSNYAHRLAPELRIPGVTAPVRLEPVMPSVSAVTGSSSQATFTLNNTSADPITWSATPTLTWMMLSPSHGALAAHGSARLTVTINPQGIEPGVYTGALMVLVGYGASEEPVMVTIKPGAQLAVTQRALSFTHCGEPQSLTLSNAGGEKLTYTATPSQTSALAVGPGSGTLAPGASTALSVTVSCDATAGDYAVIIASNGGSAQVSVAYR